LDLLNFLKTNVIAATGCTEPIAIAYAVSLAYHALFQNNITTDATNTFRFSNKVPTMQQRNLNKIEIEVDQNVYKNAYSAIIPGTDGLKGIDVAAAIALYLNPKDKLNLFKNIHSVKMNKIKQILNKNLIEVSYIEDHMKNYLLSIDVTLKYQFYNEERISQVKVRKFHNNIVEINVDGVNMYSNLEHQKNEKEETLSINLEEILKSVDMAGSNILEEVNIGILMNKRIVKEALANQYGLNIANSLNKIFIENKSSNSIISEIRMKVAAAGDARMGGSNLPVMTSSGSGNMGLIAILPIIIMGERKGISKAKVQRAILLSHIITSIADKYLGHLSVLCGAAIKAGFGVAAGITYLLNGSQTQINTAINLLAANNVGFFCDGAKPGCALKISTVAGIATECALMALNNQKIGPENGIVFKNSDDTLSGIGNLCHSIYALNKKIIEIIKRSNKN
jgi:L-cysteine desulfidase